MCVVAVEHIKLSHKESINISIQRTQSGEHYCSFHQTEIDAMGSGTRLTRCISMRVQL